VWVDAGIAWDQGAVGCEASLTGCLSAESGPIWRLGVQVCSSAGPESLRQPPQPMDLDRNGSGSQWIRSTADSQTTELSDARLGLRDQRRGDRGSAAGVPPGWLLALRRDGCWRCAGTAAGVAPGRPAGAMRHNGQASRVSGRCRDMPRRLFPPLCRVPVTAGRPPW
jgi:hypothetical protein